MTNLDTTAKMLHATARRKGFWNSYDPEDSFTFYAKQLAMVHSEVTEVLEAIRKDQGEEKVVEEIADIIIRVLDFYEGLKTTGEISRDLSLDGILAQKSIINNGRPERHGVRG
jgi:NTP pyrophosphatase (non-canonical NTP hydrolase)